MSSIEANQPEIFLHPSKSDWERLLGRIVQSAPFRRASRLREFLTYVGNEVILNGAENLPEQQIGTAVFGRPPIYDTSQDNIVRVNAMELRKRLDLYFAEEGKDEPLIFEIPRGSYTPVFRLRPLDRPKYPEVACPEASLNARPATPVPDVAVPVYGSVARLALQFRSALPLLLIAVILCLSGLLLVVLRQVRQRDMALHKWQSSPAMRAFWVNFYGGNYVTEIVLGDSSFGLAQQLLHRQFTLAEYLDSRYRSTQVSDPRPSAASEQAQKDLAAILSHNISDIGSFRVARRLAEFETGNFGSRLLTAREYSAHRLHWNNTVFVSSNRSNPWIDLYEDRFVYHFKYTPDLTTSTVTIDHPAGSEQAQYALSPETGSSAAYCIIAFLANPTNTGSIIILNGSDSEATEAGGDFLTNEESLEKLQTLLHHREFPYFQLLLRIPRSNGTPLGSEIVSYRIEKK